MANYSYQGNLAFDEARIRLESDLSNLNSASWDASPARKRELELKQASESLEAQFNDYQLVRKSSALARRKLAISIVLLVASLAFVFGNLLVRQAKIYELNFANTGIRMQIEEAKEVKQDLQNRLLNYSDTAHIESEALRLFSLRKASQKQRVMVDLPESDQLLIYDDYQSPDAPYGEQSQINYRALEAYMKSLKLR